MSKNRFRKAEISINKHSNILCGYFDCFLTKTIKKHGNKKKWNTLKFNSGQHQRPPPPPIPIVPVHVNMHQIREITPLCINDDITHVCCAWLRGRGYCLGSKTLGELATLAPTSGNQYTWTYSDIFITLSIGLQWYVERLFSITVKPITLR